MDFGNFLSNIPQIAVCRESAILDNTVRTHIEVCNHFDALHEEISPKEADGSFKDWPYPQIDVRGLIVLYALTIVVCRGNVEHTDMALLCLEMIVG